MNLTSSIFARDFVFSNLLLNNVSGVIPDIQPHQTLTSYHTHESSMKLVEHGEFMYY